MNEVHPPPPGPDPSPVFIDLFAGCGGLSLGLLQGGWKGLLALERDPMAFETYRFNLIDGNRGFKFEWPGWLPKQAHDIRRVLAEHEEHLKELRGKVDLIAGGPPCQGFSFAGRRRSDDPRNSLFKDYLELVRLVEPRVVIIENVGGMAVRHGKKHQPYGTKRPYTDKILEGLRELEYQVFDPVVLRASDYGVPQRRPRVFILALRTKGQQQQPPLPALDKVLASLRSAFLRERGLPVRRPVTTGEAISDLEMAKSRTYKIEFRRVPGGFRFGKLGKAGSKYQRLMRCSHREGFSVDSHRFANHSLHIETRFSLLLQFGRRGVQLSPTERAGIYMTQKHVIVALGKSMVAHTLTTLPDDLIHYSQPRILTVREMARLQSFPDWFEFKGKFTTGGLNRVKQAPRYTQVGNAVAPLVAEIVAGALRRYLEVLQGIPSAMEALADLQERAGKQEVPGKPGLALQDAPATSEPPASPVEPGSEQIPAATGSALPVGSKDGVADAA